MKLKWYNILYQFWIHNLEKHIKRISIGFGSFLIVLLTTCTLPTPIFLATMYGAGVSFGTMVIMSIFGKNGNGQPIVEKDKLIRPYKPESKSELEVIQKELVGYSKSEVPKEKITIP